MEKILKQKIIHHLESNNLLNNSQRGVRTGKSCLTQLLENFEELQDALDSGDDVDVVYLDCRKAFDALPHRRLLNKLKVMEISGDILNWIENFLTGRVQHVAIKDSHSEWI